mmetsp:Transcript_10294/g.14547  ORF Transcript_10294/g.14547 Transcript_10294/m.14547 type:complete len:404 (+) Transcript_10294:102-1313(+)
MIRRSGGIDQQRVRNTDPHFSNANKKQLSSYPLQYVKDSKASEVDVNSIKREVQNMNFRDIKRELQSRDISTSYFNAKTELVKTLVKVRVGEATVGANKAVKGIQTQASQFVQPKRRQSLTEARKSKSSSEIANLNEANLQSASNNHRSNTIYRRPSHQRNMSDSNIKFIVDNEGLQPERITNSRPRSSHHQEDKQSVTLQKSAREFSNTAASRNITRRNSVERLQVTRTSNSNTTRPLPPSDSEDGIRPLVRRTSLTSTTNSSCRRREKQAASRNSQNPNKNNQRTIGILGHRENRSVLQHRYQQQRQISNKRVTIAPGRQVHLIPNHVNEEMELMRQTRFANTTGSAFQCQQYPPSKSWKGEITRQNSAYAAVKEAPESTKQSLRSNTTRNLWGKQNSIRR